MDPRSKAEFDLEMAKFRKAIGQEPEHPLTRLALLSGGVLPQPKVPSGYHSQTWHQHLSYITPAAARAIMGMPIYFPEPSRWDRLKGTFFVRLRDFRRWLGSKIAGCECDTTW